MNLTIVISSAGRRAGLIECFREDARQLGIGLRVVATDLRPQLSAACQLADRCYAVPRCTDSDFLPALLEICRMEKAALLIPTIDPELPVLSAARQAFATAGTRVVISAPSVVGMARDKVLTARTLAKAGISTPRTLLWEEFVKNPSQLREPVIAKPINGSSSVGIIRPRHAGELLKMVAGTGYLVQELWDGTEYTVNVFFDACERLCSVVPHRRLEVRAGEVSKGVTQRMPQLETAAGKLAKVLHGAAGPLCFQAIVTAEGDYCVFEINARFGGGYPLAHRAGAKFSLWLLEEAAGCPSTAGDQWRAGVTMLRYDRAVFVDPE